MSRRRKIVLKVLISIVAAILIVIGSLYFLLMRTPVWFKPITMTEQERGDYFTQATKQLFDLANSVDKAAVSTRPSDSTFTLTLTEPQVHAYYESITQRSDVARMIDSKVKDSQIRLRDGQIIVAGRVPGIDSVVSARFSIDTQSDKKGPVFRLDGIYGGSLPLPDSVFAAQKEAALRAIDSEVNRLRGQMKLDPPDDKALQVLTATNMVDLLNGKPVDSLVILKRGASAGQSYARVIDAKINDGTATLTFRLATEAEIAALKKRLTTG
ncbi:MAG: hypothetical protein QM770_04050 [Tepidisphaeraceae bacterium]